MTIAVFLLFSSIGIQAQTTQNTTYSSCHWYKGHYSLKDFK